MNNYILKIPAKNKKGQIVIYDFIFGFIIFIVLISITTLLWFTNGARVAQDLEQDTKLKIAHDVAIILTNTPGDPDRWEYESLDYCKNLNCTIGLALDNNVLSEDKVSRFIEMASSPTVNYSRVKELLNIKEYDYQLIIRHKNGTIMSSSGIDPENNISASITRIVRIDGDTRKFEFTIY
ncbi:hypothetical protein H6503_03320 [Candidatus Woesearchaeota archaeon]|nr:hypothetical protein [Candidatus Woesearchaeota archaeon]